MGRAGLSGLVHPTALACTATEIHRNTHKYQRTPVAHPTHHSFLPPLKTDNYLIDAILDVPRTRQMYMRRLRTLMDAFQPTGRLQVGAGQPGAERFVHLCTMRCSISVQLRMAAPFCIWAASCVVCPSRARQPTALPTSLPLRPRSKSSPRCTTPSATRPSAMRPSGRTQVRLDGGKGWAWGGVGQEGVDDVASPATLLLPCHKTVGLLLAPAGDPDRGYQQLVSEQVPMRQRQLYETYGPRGPIPLIPGAGCRAACGIAPQLREGVLLFSIAHCSPALLGHPAERAAASHPLPLAPSLSSLLCRRPALQLPADHGSGGAGASGVRGGAQPQRLCGGRVQLRAARRSQLCVCAG